MDLAVKAQVAYLLHYCQFSIPMNILENEESKLPVRNTVTNLTFSIRWKQKGPILHESKNSKELDTKLYHSQKQQEITGGAGRCIFHPLQILI